MKTGSWFATSSPSSPSLIEQALNLGLLLLHLLLHLLHLVKSGRQVRLLRCEVFLLVCIFTSTVNRSRNPSRGYSHVKRWNKTIPSSHTWELGSGLAWIISPEKES